jgi:hypothetical protein
MKAFWIAVMATTSVTSASRTVVRGGPSTLLAGPLIAAECPDPASTVQRAMPERHNPHAPLDSGALLP